MERGCIGCGISGAGLPRWYDIQPGKRAQILDVRKIKKISAKDQEHVWVKFSTADNHFGKLQCSWQPLVHSYLLAMRDKATEKETARLQILKASIFQMAVQEGVIITARLAAVGKLRSNRFRSFPVDPERRQGEEELFGITLSLVTDHNYVFLRDCKQIEQEGGTLSEERKERIYSIWKAYDRYRQHTTSAFA